MCKKITFSIASQQVCILVPVRMIRGFLMSDLKERVFAVTAASDLGNRLKRKQRSW